MNMGYRDHKLRRGLQSEIEAKVSLRILCLLSCFLFAVIPSVSVSDHPVDKAGMKERLNKIFYWHLADELKFSPQQEKSVVELLNNLQSKREHALKNREEAIESLQGLDKSAPLSKTKPYLDKYMQSSETLAGLDKEEYEGLKNIIGEELLGRFYIIREDVTSRVRKALKK